MKDLGSFYNPVKFYSYWMTSLETVDDSFWPNMAPEKAKIWKKPQNPRRGAGDGTLKAAVTDGIETSIYGS